MGQGIDVAIRFPRRSGVAARLTDYTIFLLTSSEKCCMLNRMRFLSLVSDTVSRSSENRNIGINCRRRRVRFSRAGTVARALSRKLSQFTPREARKGAPQPSTFSILHPVLLRRQEPSGERARTAWHPGTSGNFIAPLSRAPRSRPSAELGGKMELPTAQNGKKSPPRRLLHEQVGDSPAHHARLLHSPPLQLAEAKRVPGTTKRTCVPLRLWHATGVAGGAP